MAGTMENDKLNGDSAHEANHKLTEEDMNKINSLKSEKYELQPLNREDSESSVDRVKFAGLDNNDSICSEESDDEEIPPIPDGGWGWVVVAAAFIVTCVTDGLSFSFGVLHLAFKQYFNSKESMTSLIGSLFIATPLIAGPVMSALVDRFGCRGMTMIAGVLSTIGFLLASVSNSVEMLCLTFGFLSGLGMGVLHVTAVVSVAFWFDKKRNLAVSLASCGFGVGTFIFSPFVNWLIEEYGWRNTIIVLAGVLLHMCVCGAVMRNPEWLEVKERKERKLLKKARSRKTSSAGSTSPRSIGGESVFLTAEELKSLLKSGKSPDYILATLASSIAEARELEATTQMNVENSLLRIHSAIHLPTFVQQNEKVPPEVLENLMEDTRLYNVIIQNYPELINRRKSAVQLNVEKPPPGSTITPAKLPVEVYVSVKNIKEKTPDDSNENKDIKINNVQSVEDTNTGVISSLLERESRNVNDTIDSCTKKNNTISPDKKPPAKSHAKPQQGWMSQISGDHHYLRELPLYRNNMVYRGVMMNIPRYRLRASSMPDMYRNSMWSIASSVDMTIWDRALEVAKSMFDVRMLTEFHFVLFNVSSIIMAVWSIVPFFYLKSYMEENGSEGGEVMTSITGATSGIGIVFLGWAGDRPWMNVSKAYASCLILSGVSVAAYPLFINNYWALAIISAVFGFTFASSYSYIPAILMELMPIDYFTVAYGLMLLSEGIGHLAGPPIAGSIYDLTKTWDLTFYIAGIWLVISGVCVGVLAYTHNFRICGKSALLNDEHEDMKNKEAEAV